MIKKQTFEQWEKTLDQNQIDFILKDYFSSHPDYNTESEKLETIYS